MATNKSNTQATSDSIEDGVRGFSMAIREAVMDYYKGTCIQSFSSLSQYHVRQGRIPLQNDGSRRNFNYEREEHSRRFPIEYYLDGARMFEVWRNDQEVIFSPSVMRRSEELSVAYDQILEFFNKFLPSVTIIEKDTKNSKNHTDGSRDREYIYRSLSEQYRSEEDDDDYDEEDEEDF